MRGICIVLLAGLVSACGDGGGQAADDTALTALDAAGATAAISGDTGEGTQAAAGASGAAVTTEATTMTGATTTGATTTGASGGRASLPLPLGFYVSADVACSGASNATLQLLRRDGINTSRVPCKFESVVQTGPTTYRVTETCVEGGAAWGTEESVSTTTSTYEMLSATSFKAISDDGWENTVKHCPQADLPEPWRDNDIADLVG